MRTNFASTLLVSFLFLSCASSPSQKRDIAAQSMSPLRTVIEAYSERVKRLDPYDAAYFNVEENLGTFGDYASPEYFQRSKNNLLQALNDLKSVDASKLTAAEQLEYRIFKEDLETSLGWFDYPNRYLSLNQMGSRLRDYIDSSSEALTIFPFDTFPHYMAYVKRSEGFPAYVDRQIALLKEGMAKQVVLSCTVAPKVINTYSEALEPSVEKNPFYRPIQFMPASFSDAQKGELKQLFATMVRDRILPSVKKFDTFFKNEYMPKCRKPFGLSRYPNMREWYRWQIRSNTNLDMDPKTIHQIGLKEVARIATELEKIKTQRGFKGTLPQFISAMSNDPKSYFGSGAEMFKAFEKAKEQIAAKLPQAFSLTSKIDFKIVETSNPEDAAGAYSQPTESAPFGRFIVNTKNVRSVPVFGVMTLMLHETNPGHHMQLALQYEMKDQLSEYRRKMFSSNAFVEGWALYSEFLGNEMGLFDDPEQRLGNLNDEMLRAVRLVVDTGIHTMGWSQKRAIAYASRYLALDAEGISVEINRYSVWPGQALGYKIGQLKILELRRKAEKSLGPKFDLKEFHRVVVGSGTVPLNVLESNVDEWILARR